MQLSSATSPGALRATRALRSYMPLRASPAELIQFLWAKATQAAKFVSLLNTGEALIQVNVFWFDVRLDRIGLRLRQLAVLDRLIHGRFFRVRDRGAEFRHIHILFARQV